MKKFKTAFLCMIMIMTMSFVFAGSAQAASTKLFTMVVNDGFVKQNIPVYEKKNGNTVTVTANITGGKLPVYAGASKASFSITGKSSYFIKNYKSVIYMKSVKLAPKSVTSLKLYVRNKSGKKVPFIVKIRRPAMPAISSLSVSPNKTLNCGGSNKLTIGVKTSTPLALNTYIKVTNSAGKLVYKKVFGKKASSSFSGTWDGKPSSDNNAGLSTSSYVPSGTYTLTAFMDYKVGSKTTYIKKSTTLTVKTAATAAAPAPSGTTVGRDWDWKVKLSGDKDLDYLAEIICQKAGLKNGMTESARAKALYKYLGEHMDYSKASSPDVFDITSSNAKAAIDAYAKQCASMISSGKAVTTMMFRSTTDQGWGKRGMRTLKGDCWIMSDTYVAVLGHAGITATYVENDRTKNPPNHHIWNVVTIGGKNYYCDVNQAESYRKNGGNGNIHYEFFLRGTKYFYQHGLYSTVKTDAKTAAITKTVSATDCPTR